LALLAPIAGILILVASGLLNYYVVPGYPILIGLFGG